MTSKRLDLTGMVFGRLTAIKHSDVRHSSGRLQWTCICSCGNTTHTKTSSLTGGRTRSCGCLQTDNLLIGQRMKLWKYPQTPTPYPNDAARLFNKYKYLVTRIIRVEGDICGLEEIATDRLYRACYICVYTNKPSDEIERYLWAWLNNGRSKSQLRRLDKHGMIKDTKSLGGQMTELKLRKTLSSDDGVASRSHRKRITKKIKFRRC